jgi:threonine dehydrogenase-like Zn-dependent dehydrogenase
MKGTVLYGPRDVRFEERDAPTIIEPTDAIIRISATCVCGSDLWPYRGISPVPEPTPMGHEYCGIVEKVGSAVTSIKPGQFVIGSFFASDNTCPHCQAGYQTSCRHKEFISTAQAPMLRVPLADGTLVATPGVPSDDLIPSLLAVSDVLGTGWFAADAANVKPGMSVAVVGDGAVGLLAVLSAKQMGAGRIIAMSRHESRQKLAREFGATDIVTERGDEGVARIKELTDGIGADAVLECVGTHESMMQAIRSTRPAIAFIFRQHHQHQLGGKHLGTPTGSVYSATKAAVDAVTKSLIRYCRTAPIARLEYRAWKVSLEGWNQDLDNTKRGVVRQRKIRHHAAGYFGQSRPSGRHRAAAAACGVGRPPRPPTVPL